MKVSIVIPTYNRGYFIHDALNSVLNQQYRDYEILLVDDGSSDGTQQVVKSFGDARIRYIRHRRNRGCSAAYNTGISAATGLLVAFLDSDDVWKPAYLDQQVSFLVRHPEVGVVFCDTEIHGRATSIPSLMSVMQSRPMALHEHPRGLEYVFTRRQMYLWLLEEVPVKPTAMVVRRHLLQSAQPFNERWPSGTDWDLVLRLSRVASFGYIDASLAVQRRTADATHQKFREQDKRFLLSIFLKEKSTIRNDREAMQAVNRGISNHYNSLAWIYRESGQRRKAWKTYAEGFKETLQWMMLVRLLSVVLPLNIEHVFKRAISRGRGRDGKGAPSDLAKAPADRGSARA